MRCTQTHPMRPRSLIRSSANVFCSMEGMSVLNSQPYNAAASAGAPRDNGGQNAAGADMEPRDAPL